MEVNTLSLLLVGGTLLGVAGTLRLFDATSRLAAWAVAAGASGVVLVAVPPELQAATLVVVALGIFGLLHAKEDNATMTVPVAPGVLVSPLLLFAAAAAAHLKGATMADLRGAGVAIVAVNCGLYAVVALHKKIRDFAGTTVGGADFLLMPVICGVPGLLAGSPLVVLYALLAAQAGALVHALARRAGRMDHFPALPGMFAGSLAVAVAAAAGVLI